MPKYLKPPIQEAICQFEFAQDEWGITTQGELYSEFRTDYAGLPETRQELLQPPGGLQLVPVTRLVLKSADSHQQMILSPGMISVHAVESYPGFDAFHETMRSAVGRYRKVCNPNGLQHVNLRYINRIEVPADARDLSPWLQQAPRAVSSNTGFPSLFAHQYTFPLPEGGWLFLNLATPKGQDESSEIRKVMLDMNAFFARPENGPEWGDEMGFAKIRQLHEHLSDAFESSLTDLLKETYHVLTE